MLGLVFGTIRVKQMRGEVEEAKSVCCFLTGWLRLTKMEVILLTYL